MTYDEWQKARVEALLEIIGEAQQSDERKEWSIPVLTPLEFAEKALKDLAAIPVPSEEEAVKIIKEVNYSFAHAHVLRDTVYKAMIAALRPWIAAQIEKGK